MSAIKLADQLKNTIDSDCLDSEEEEWYSEIETMLRQQAKEIEQLNFVLKNLTLATNKKINELEEDLKDCICQGGHSKAYLQAKGKL